MLYEQASRWGRAALLQEVVSDDETVSGRNRFDLVRDVRIPGESGEVEGGRVGGCKSMAPVAMGQVNIAALVFRRK